MQNDHRRSTFMFTKDDYIDTIKEQMTELTFDWCNGVDF